MLGIKNRSMLYGLGTTKLNDVIVPIFLRNT